MTVYGLASLLHFAHNAVYLRAYPNMPAWLTPVGVWAAFLALTAVGVLGYRVYRAGSRAVGLTIAMEAAAAATLLVYLGTSRQGAWNTTDEI